MKNMFIRKLNIKGNYCIVQCEVCDEQRQIRYNSNILSKETHLCKACSAKKSGLEKRGKYTAHNKKDKLGEKRSGVGSSYINTHGYIETYLGSDHGKCNRRDKYVLQHRLIAELMTGKKLEDKQLVHHVDDDRTNNQPNNLFICENISHHRKVHSQLESIAFELVKKGVIQFDHNKGTYYMPHLEEILDAYSVNSEEPYVLDIENMAILSQGDAKSQGATTIPLGSRHEVVSKRTASYQEGG